MKDVIVSKLAEIEERENVRIIHAVESGSRAWGFASPDSDYDVRFIYVRPLDFYLRLDKTRDVIEWQLDETLDINGWDLQKTLRLLHSSNPTLFEWNNSPIVYKTTDEWAVMQKELDNYFSVKSSLHHYFNIALNNYHRYLRAEVVRLKIYFYAIRSILACKWILDKKCPPPVLFSDLAESVLESDIIPIIDDLLRLKIKTPEIGEGKRIERLNKYIENNLSLIKNTIDTLPNEHPGEWDRLNELFLSILKERNLW